MSTSWSAATTTTFATTNPTSANYLNDCVEFYIDPGNDGGSTAMSSSTSDVQLVIDANNQKNVYGTTAATRPRSRRRYLGCCARPTGWSWK